jgi:tight adherence protein C
MTVVAFLAALVLTLGARRFNLPTLGGSRPSRGDDPSLTLAELTALGLSAGLGFPAAVRAAADRLPDELAAVVRRRLRSGRPNDGADFAEGLFALAGRAEVTGAPLLPSIDGYARSLRRDARAAAVERARRLPMKLLFPLALLILPGFLLLTVAPAFLAGIDRLGL